MALYQQVLVLAARKLAHSSKSWQGRVKILNLLPVDQAIAILEKTDEDVRLDILKHLNKRSQEIVLNMPTKSQRKLKESTGVELGEIYVAFS
jgi:Mg/Co/Ni transporter MgtE